MINIWKLELVKIVLHNKRNQLYQIINNLKTISIFIDKSGSPTSFLKDGLSEMEIVEVGEHFYKLFGMIESGIHTNLRMEFNQFSDEFRYETVYWCDEILEQLMDNLQFNEIQLVEDTIHKLDANINRLKNN